MSAHLGVTFPSQLCSAEGMAHAATMSWGMNMLVVSYYLRRWKDKQLPRREDDSKALFGTDVICVRGRSSAHCRACGGKSLIYGAVARAGSWP